MKIPKNKKPDPAKLCDLCGEVFRNHDRLTAHKKAVHFKNPVKCPKCPRVCVSEYYLNRHIKRKHDANRDFICSVCGQSFAFKGELSSHNKNVHNKHLKPKRTYQCKFCDKTYKCQKSVTIHERSIHTGNIDELIVHVIHNLLYPSLATIRMVEPKLNFECSTSQVLSIRALKTAAA